MSIASILSDLWRGAFEAPPPAQELLIDAPTLFVPHTVYTASNGFMYGRVKAYTTSKLGLRHLWHWTCMLWASSVCPSFATGHPINELMIWDLPAPVRPTTSIDIFWFLPCSRNLETSSLRFGSLENSITDFLRGCKNKNTSWLLLSMPPPEESV